MKKIIKILFVFVISLISIKTVYAYYSTNSDIKNVFSTGKYNISFNSNGGVYQNIEDIFISNNHLTSLPIPIRNGYSCSSYYINGSNINYSINDSVNIINNKTLSCNWDINTYQITYNLNGGVINNNKNNYQVTDESFTLPIPVKEGYIFIGWTGSNGDIPEVNVTIPKGSYGDKEYTANYGRQSFSNLIKTVVDGITYDNGLEDYTFDIWIDGVLVGDDVINYNEPIEEGKSVRIKTNSLDGRSTNYDVTSVVNSNTSFRPSWTVNSYNSIFMLNERLIATTQNKYGCYVNVPNITIYDIGWDPDGYYISDIVPVESWYQKSHTMQFNIIMDEYYCWASFGSADYNNAVAQLNLIEQQGYYFCSINDWNGLDCFEKYNNLLDLYYNAWNFLPTYGYGWSRYRQLVCDSGYTEEARR